MKTTSAILGHIDYSLKHIDGLCWLCTMLIEGIPHGDLKVYAGDRLLIRRSTISALQNPLAESGLVYCRKVLDFLGLKIDRPTGKLKARHHAYSDDTVGIEDLSLPRVGIAALGGTPFGSVSEVQAACEHTIRAANKGVAHFSEDIGDHAEERPVLLCGKAVTWLTERYVYNALGIPVPDFRVWTK